MSNTITTLSGWGRSFVVDFFLHYTGLTFIIIAHTDLKITSSFYDTFSLPWYDYGL